MCLSDEELGEIQRELEGTCTSLTEIVEREDLDLTEDELEDRLLDGEYPIERSKCCEWWFQVSELTHSEDHGGGLCENCHPAAFD